jgi:hypothetical protein
MGHGFSEVSRMRFVGYAIFILAALWLGDMLFFKGRYTNEVLVEADKQIQDLNYTFRRWARF